ncbi:VOC family protein [Trichothermofontia sichuanensis B231]|uniref:VOC family protein n=1 Tax=Trichothermofontia sichuanensis TaxID=3045816 RepID=UPI002246CE4B|nr:VOC family protein [Trichothermofontia sichuanensis]UZQ54683.1 VOC family protein [Trichothermofontia sichuanensis B231]
MGQALFHLAFPITDVEQAKAFYVAGLGCELGRVNDKAIILNLYGHQLVGHVTQEPLPVQQGIYPRHFGLVFSEEADWEALLARAQANGLDFYQPPKYRFPGTVLAHRTFFLCDPFANLLEFKYYAHPEAVFGAHEQTAIGDR